MENLIINKEVRSVSGFNSVKFKAVGKLIITQGAQESLTIQADQEIRARIHTDVIEGVLIISYDADWKDWTGFRLVDKGPTVYNLTMKEIKSLAISGVGSLDAAEITSDALTLNLAGPGVVTIGTLKVNSLIVDMSGVGSIDVAGTCLDQNVVLSGAGNYKSSRLESERTSVKLSGVGNATVWANQSLDAHISGAGAVEYYGNAKITQKVSGIGMLKYLGNR
ncbi:MAG: hypothetical protein C0401_02495 [Anaerolinea sp.]|nr:hypothetical protein [Anaerolinea sp.]